MLNFHSSTAVMHFMQLLVAAFLAILFLQSGIDKIFDWRGNLDFVKDHFARSPLARMAAPMFGLLTILELAAGALSAVGCLLIVLQGDTAIALDGALIAAIAITALFSCHAKVYCIFARNQRRWTQRYHGQTGPGL